MRGVRGAALVILMNKADIDKRHLAEGQKVTLQMIADDGLDRRLEGLDQDLCDTGRLHRRLLPRMQRAAAALALCEEEQGAGSQVDPGEDHRRVTAGRAVIGRASLRVCDAGSGANDGGN